MSTLADVILRYSEGSGPYVGLRRSFGVPLDDRYDTHSFYEGVLAQWFSSPRDLDQLHFVEHRRIIAADVADGLILDCPKWPRRKLGKVGGLVSRFQFTIQISHHTV